MKKAGLAMDYEVAVDETVIDGRQLAVQLIVDAWKLLIPYTKECPACAEKMFTVLANDALDAELATWKRSGRAGGIRLFHQCKEDDQETAFEAHRLRTENVTREILGVDDHGHDSA